jgi:hypothetical protein
MGSDERADLMLWRLEEYSNGNRIKAIHIQRVLDRWMLKVEHLRMGI